MSEKGEADGDDWARVQALFHAAEALPAGERAAFLEQHAEPHLRAQVASLLGAADEATGVADRVAQQAGQFPVGGLNPGDLVGEFRIREKLGEGGMGAVFLAERADGAFEQQVAIKLLHASMARPAFVARFESERRILSALRHPNIARLLGGGATAGGVPYLVMEHIEGESITAYCDRLGLDLRQRLRLFLSLCKAVQAAHQRLVVHRDLKPSNVLIEADGTLKLLDFGIAKVLGEDGTAEETVAATRMMTLEYASPEQVRGSTITTATDIYALGGLLFRLLAGRIAFDELREDTLALQQAICETPPPRPSLFVSAADSGRPRLKLSRDEAGDIDAIVLKAMRLEPEERYVSAAALADDIARFLERQPVLARRGNRRYQLRRFLQRNARALAVASLVAALLIGTVSVYTVELERQRALAVSARDAAEAERATAEEVADFMIGLFTGANPDQTKPGMTAQDLLDAGAERVRTELADSPRLRGRLLFSIGLAYWAQGLRGDSEARMREGITLLRDAGAPERARLAGALRTLAYKLMIPERYAEAEELLREALAIQEAELGAQAPLVADLLLDLERIYAQRDHDTSMARFEASERARRIYAAAGLLQSEGYLRYLSVRANWHKMRFEWPEARRFAREALELDRALSGPQAYIVAFSAEDLGRLEYFSGRYLVAREHLQAARRTIIEYKGPRHVDLGWSQYFLARIARELGEHAQARQLLDELIEIERETPNTPDNRYLARALCGQALLLADAGELGLARERCLEGQALLQASTQKRVQMDVVHEALGIIALAAGDTATAVSELAAMAAIREAETDPAQLDTPYAMALHASALTHSGQEAAALQRFAAAESLARERYGDDFPTLGRLLWARAALHARRGEAQLAEADRAEAQRIFALQGLVAQRGDWRLLPSR